LRPRDGVDQGRVGEPAKGGRRVSKSILVIARVSKSYLVIVRVSKSLLVIARVSKSYLVTVRGRWR